VSKRIKTTQRIWDVVRALEDEYRLPSIQRSFVWEENRIAKLADSLMNDYPIGSMLVWRPPSSLRIRTRRFVRQYWSGMHLISEDEPISESTYLVLDGQQRLQSLYLTFFGQYDGKHMYFKTNSDPEADQDSLRYQFSFLPEKEVSNDPHWIRPSELTKLNVEDVSAFVDERHGSDPSVIKKRIVRNISKFIRVFNIDEKIIFLDVEEKAPYDDVLEIFVRTNSGGVKLTKTDLIFATIVLKVPDLERQIRDLVDELNLGGQYDFDIDFLVKTTFVLLGKGAKYDVSKLRDDPYVERLSSGFGMFRSALLSTIDFVRTDAKILSKRFLKSELALIPIIDFIFQSPHQQVLEGQSRSLRQYLYMSFFMRFFSYGADGKLDYMHKIFEDKDLSKGFPIADVSQYMSNRTNLSYEFAESMLADLDLVLNIAQGGVTEIPSRRGWSLERDHIFPRSVLEKKGIPEKWRDDVGNFRLVNKTRNILKSDDLPEKNLEFFGSSNSTIKSLFLKNRDNLNERNFQQFVTARRTLLMSTVKAFLGFS